MAPIKTELPDYTKKQEFWNSFSHALGVLFALVGGPFLIAKAAQSNDGIRIFSSIVFVLSLLILYAGSAIYHGLPKGNLKRVFRVLDHDNVFILIMGTYVPYTLVGLHSYSVAWCYSILGPCLALGVLGIVLNSIDLKKFSVFCIIDYILMGWIIIISFYPLIQSIGWYPASFMLLMGGVSYTVGAILYCVGIRHSKWFHLVFHLFVLLGTLLMFVSLYYWVF